MKNFIIAAVFFSLPGLSGAHAAAVSEQVEVLVRLAPAVRPSALPQAVQRMENAPVAPLLMDAAELAQAPRIIATSDRRALAGKGDRITVEGDLHGIAEFRIVRPSRKLQDPQSGESLGDEVVALGKALLQREGTDSAHSFIITSSAQEITTGDLLIADTASVADFAAARSGAAVDALIVSIAGGAAYAAQSQVIGINKGARDNVVAGMSLALSTKNTQQQASGSPKNESGRLLILRVYDRVSYGLITESVEALQVGDKAFAPSTEYTPH